MVDACCSIPTECMANNLLIFVFSVLTTHPQITYLQLDGAGNKLIIFFKIIFRLFMLLCKNWNTTHKFVLWGTAVCCPSVFWASSRITPKQDGQWQKIIGIIIQNLKVCLLSAKYCSITDTHTSFQPWRLFSSVESNLLAFPQINLFYKTLWKSDQR